MAYFSFACQWERNNCMRGYKLIRYVLFAYYIVLVFYIELFYCTVKIYSTANTARNISAYNFDPWKHVKKFLLI